MFCTVSTNQSGLTQFVPRVGYILSPFSMLTMSTADKTFTIKSFVSKKESACKDTNNVNYIEYVTHIQTTRAENRIRDHLIKIHGTTFLITTTDFSQMVLLQSISLFK